MLRDMLDFVARIKNYIAEYLNERQSIMNNIIDYIYLIIQHLKVVPSWRSKYFFYYKTYKRTNKHLVL